MFLPYNIKVDDLGDAVVTPAQPAKEAYDETVIDVPGYTTLVKVNRDDVINEFKANHGIDWTLIASTNYYQEGVQFADLKKSKTQWQNWGCNSMPSAYIKCGYDSNMLDKEYIDINLSWSASMEDYHIANIPFIGFLYKKVENYGGQTHTVHHDGVDATPEKKVHRTRTTYKNLVGTEFTSIDEQVVVG